VPLLPPKKVKILLKRGYCPRMEKLELPLLTLGVSARVEKIT